jgi:hypothetical protein
MIDALLLAARDRLRTDLGYDARTCEVMPDGKPQAKAGNYFVAICQGPSSCRSMNSLDEYFSFALTLSMRVTVPQDRIGDQLLARKLAAEIGFNARANALAVALHMDWLLLQAANTLLVEMNPQAVEVYGFCEPAHFAGMDVPSLIGGEWFGGKAGDRPEALVAEIRFEDARRMQALQVFS